MCDTFDVVENPTERDIDVFCHSEFAIKQEGLSADDDIGNYCSGKKQQRLQ
ncbi:MAG TPA: hypothetical protein VK186_12765 [Candidatus Deferrimicrobium sp.]|nr:hypothetical protein [Candidatus Deferrimicrobium sp.]